MRLRRSFGLALAFAAAMATTSFAAASADPGQQPKKKAAVDPWEIPPEPKTTLPSTPEGHYIVVVSAGWGQTTSQGEFYLDADGTYRDVWNKKKGKWTYDKATGAVKFLDGAYKDAAIVFNPATNVKGALKITFPGIEPVWAYRQSK